MCVVLATRLARSCSKFTQPGNTKKWWLFALHVVSLSIAKCLSSAGQASTFGRKGRRTLPRRRPRRGDVPVSHGDLNLPGHRHSQTEMTTQNVRVFFSVRFAL